MNDAQKSELRNAIVGDIEKVTADIRQLKEVTKPVSPDNSLGRLTRMDNIVNQGVSKAALIQAEARLERLKYALANIDDEEFGYCIECGEPIPMLRLRAMPETRLCVECAE